MKKKFLGKFREFVRAFLRDETLKHSSPYLKTKEEQDKYTPQMVLDDLIAGNERFTRGEHTVRDHSRTMHNSYPPPQYPKAFILSCIDSRVLVEDIFDQGVGDIFVGRVAGNYATDDMIASMEYACVVTGAKLILVLGHENCGAIKGAIQGVELGLLTGLLDKIRPAVCDCEHDNTEHTPDNYDYTHNVAVWNVRHSLQQIRRSSPILRQLEADGKLMIRGAFYGLSTGVIEVFDY